MSKENIIIGLDLGVSQIRTIIAQVSEESSQPLVLGVGVVPSAGIDNNGMIVNIEETVQAINQSKEAAERIAGVPVEHAFISVNGKHITSQFSKGVIAVSRADGEISEADVIRVSSAAQAVSVPNNKEIIDAIPCGYTIDSQEQIKDPIGMNGIRLEVNTLLIHGPSSSIKTLRRCVEQRCGIDEDGLVFAPLAAAKAVLSRRFKELGVILLDIGKETTGYVVYEDGNILSTGVIPIGAGHITKDIAIGLRIPIDVAEKVKLAYGNAVPADIDPNEEINIADLCPEEEGVFKRYYVAEIIEARVEEIFSIINEELRKIDKIEMLPAGVVISGGGAKMPGMVTVGKRVLKLPAQVGYPSNMEGVVDKVDDPAFATAVGLIMWEADENGYFETRKSGMFNFKELINKVKSFIQKFFLANFD